MFAVVRTGGKQYRVAPGDKIVVEKIAGDGGDRIDLGDVLLAGDGSDLKSVDGLKVLAEIVAQAKGDKVTVFKKRRRHNYRRKKGHRQQHTILKIVAIGDHKADGGDKKGKAKAAAAAKEAPAAKAAAPEKKSAAKPRGGETPTANPAPSDQATAKGDQPGGSKKPAAKAKAKTPSTRNAAPAKSGSSSAVKGAAKKSPKAK